MLYGPCVAGTGPDDQYAPPSNDFRGQGRLVRRVQLISVPTNPELGEADVRYGDSGWLPHRAAIGFCHAAAASTIQLVQIVRESPDRLERLVSSCPRIRRARTPPSDCGAGHRF